MKTLQNNFTTPEQSKRLLELGVPADSADCFINFCNRGRLEIIPLGETFRTWLAYGEKYDIYHFERYYPCWSVGRLMEIFNIICAAEYWNAIEQATACNNSPADWVYNFQQNSKYLDFLKLEE